MGVNKTSLSAGELIRAVLTEDPEVNVRVGRIFPVFTEKAELPYLLYRRVSMEQTPQKTGQPGADTTQIEIVCFTEQYGEGVALAEAVRAALDMRSASSGGLRMRSCMLTDSEESWQDDAYVQTLIFTVRM
ncbi:MAG: DUF3168 domain-containing protein [Bacteroides sp.]|nr:DUF3168 domain-containing protein [Bacteroides sp.]